MPRKSPQHLEKVARSLSRVLLYISMGLLAAMVLLGSADVMGRYFLNKPIWGTLEIFEILLPGIVFFALGYTQLVRGHITVDVVYSRLPPRLRARVGFATSLLLLCLFSLVVWRGIVSAITNWRAQRLLMNLNIPIFPFQLFVSLGALAIFCVLIVEMLQFLTEMREAD